LGSLILIVGMTSLITELISNNASVANSVLICLLP
jgi:hypothetical protein